MTSGVEWRVTPEEAFLALYLELSEAIFQAIYAICQMRAPEIENWMKANASWTDRTGNARQTLWTDVVTALADVVVILSHGMDYGFWLEVANSGRYAIITPALDYWGPILMRDIQAVLR